MTATAALFAQALSATPPRGRSWQGAWQLLSLWFVHFENSFICIGIQYEANDCERRHSGLGIEESLFLSEL